MLACVRACVRGECVRMDSVHLPGPPALQASCAAGTTLLPPLTRRPGGLVNESSESTY